MAIARGSRVFEAPNTVVRYRVLPSGPSLDRSSLLRPTMLSLLPEGPLQLIGASLPLYALCALTETCRTMHASLSQDAAARTRRSRARWHVTVQKWRACRQAEETLQELASCTACWSETGEDTDLALRHRLPQVFPHAEMHPTVFSSMIHDVVEDTHFQHACRLLYAVEVGCLEPPPPFSPLPPRRGTNTLLTILAARAGPAPEQTLHRPLHRTLLLPPRVRARQVSPKVPQDAISPPPAQGIVLVHDDGPHGGRRSGRR